MAVMYNYVDRELTKEQSFMEVLLFRKLRIVYQWQTNPICHSAYNSKFGGNLDELMKQGKVRVTVFSVN